MTSTQFFTALPGFTHFSDGMNDEHYSSVPEDWYVAITDVEQSTQAIHEGRYKDINMIGAACIIAVLNAIRPAEIPYVFGGDGATLLIPPEHIETAKESLLAVKHLSASTLALPLRVGIVPVKTIIDEGKYIDVAKYIMPTGCTLAMFRGGCLLLADRIVKEGHHGQYFTLKGMPAIRPDLEGLSCRWEPFKTQNGTILTLLVTTYDDTNQHSDTYQTIYQHITKLLNNTGKPVDENSARYRWPPKGTRLETTLLHQGNATFFDRIKLHAATLFFLIANRLNLKIGNFDAKTYRQDMLINSDYQKFDDMLRMVIDCSEEQASAIESYLEGLYQKKQIVYGTHLSEQALMTCFVRSIEQHGHIHFIDGDDGGYAVAAINLKQRMGAFT